MFFLKLEGWFDIAGHGNRACKSLMLTEYGWRMCLLVSTVGLANRHMHPHTVVLVRLCRCPETSESADIDVYGGRLVTLQAV